MPFQFGSDYLGSMVRMLGKPLRIRLWLIVAWLTLGSGDWSTVGAQQATPVASITIQAGFQVELLRSAQPGEDSWISMTFDDRGRLVLGLDGQGVARLTLPAEDDAAEFQLVEGTLRHCRGVLYAHQSLYVCATDSRGFYRLRDTTGDDRFDEVKLLKAMDYRSRYGHGTNQVVLGPDQMIYVVNGNDVSFPEGVSPLSPYRDPHNDWLIPNPHDAGHDDRVGHILKTDPEGESWEVIAGGFRNQFDIAFNPAGEMFTYDSDMEWDDGLPWYRPTRVNHVVSGGEYGWRWGTGKWPTSYADSLPSTLDTGLGSPTGIEFGTRSHFPTRHQQALFLADWQNGRILLVHLTPRGASYDCEYEVFLEGGPLNVCDLTFGPDGALYFITGGRGSQSGLYRVSYVGQPGALAADPSPKEDAATIEARQLRHQLEAFHTRQAAEAVEFAWPHLRSDDAWIRFAARLSIERQDLEHWRARAVAERDVNGSITALLALARQGTPEDQSRLLSALQTLQLEQLDQPQLLAALRVYALTFIRQGRPDPTTSHATAERLDSIFPHTSSTVNQELCQLLVYLKSPHVLPKTLQLLARNGTQEEQIRYVSLLVRLETGWDQASRRQILEWLAKAATFSGGKLVATTVDQLREDFLASLSDEEHKTLHESIEVLTQATTTAPIVPSRPFVRHWEMADILPELDRARRGRSYSSAREALAATACLRCHQIGEEGGRIGPDLTMIGKRFDDRAMLESILVPSAVIDPKYRHTAYVLTDGKIVQGRPVGVNARQLVIETDALTGASVTIDRATIEESQPAQLSPMPSGLVDTLTLDEILDLLAYLRTPHDPQSPAFQNQP